jgi:sigma-B regulation protein RsbU (phosphoserine phosphatase)
MKDLADCRVLIVDDARTNLDVLVEGLKGDHKLSLALNGEMALQLAARTPPDLVLLDIMMPGMDGYEVCRRMRQMPETAEVPIMFLSSLEDVQDKTRGFEAGANDYLTKPFEMLEVKARVRSLLKAKAYSDAVKEQMASELRVAREIQMGMLPHDFAGMEQAYDVEFGAALEPAREVGGDLYGICAAAKDRLVVFLGDVSGKGIPASMFMVRAVSLARLLSREIVEPERILARLNDELAADNPSGMFVTFQCAVFEPGSGRITLANAGHCRPVLLRTGEPPRWAVRDLGTALGFEPGLEFGRTELTLQSGDALVFYTDGVSEAFNPQEECYGSERLLADAGRFAGRPAAEITDGLFRKVRAFAGEAAQSDDIAILTLRVGGSPSGVPRMRMELHATPEEVMRAVEALDQLGRERRVPERELFGLSLALEECASNIVNYALQGDARRTFVVLFEDTGTAITIELRDQGLAFDPTRRPVNVHEETGDQAGGWGILLARRNTDEILYTRTGSENVLRLTKRYHPVDKSLRAMTHAKEETVNLQIQIQQNIGSTQPGTITVKLAGSLDTATAPELERQLTPVLARPVKNLVFDMAQLKFISSAGLRVISMVRKKLHEMKGTTAIVNMQPQIQEVFDIIKALPGLGIFKDVAEFDNYIAARQKMHEEGE